MLFYWPCWTRGVFRKGGIAQLSGYVESTGLQNVELAAPPVASATAVAPAAPPGAGAGASVISGGDACCGSGGTRHSSLSPEQSCPHPWPSTQIESSESTKKNLRSLLLESGLRRSNLSRCFGSPHLSPSCTDSLFWGPCRDWYSSQTMNPSRDTLFRFPDYVWPCHLCKMMSASCPRLAIKQESPS